MSTVDPPHWRPPPPTNRLTTTVCAPAAALCGPDGQIRVSDMDGLFVADVRVLTEARLSLAGTEPHHLAHLHEGPGRTRFISVARTLGDPINDPTVRIERLRQVTPDGMAEEIRISSTASLPLRTWLTMDLRCDLTPLEVAKSGRTRPDLPAAEPALTWSTDAATVNAVGTDARHSTEPPRLSWEIELAPGEHRSVRWRIRVRERHPVLAAPSGPVEWARPRVRCDDERLARLLRQSLDDLESLRLTDAAATGGPAERTFLGAGAPWFLTLFGRDSLWAARMMLPLGTALAEGTLWTLARRQGTAVNPWSGEAPGKIMHELRREDPRVARVERSDSHGPATYYGTVDATLLWISLLADAWRWGMPETSVAALLPHLTRALSWLEFHGDPDGDGFVEYLDVTGKGLANQGWKDSGNAIRFHDGRVASAPIALSEVQGYAHRAARDAADLLDAFVPAGLDGAAGRWRGYAAEVARRFRERFWVNGPLGPFPALAIDGDARPVDSLTSNIGHLLGTGLLNPAEETTVAGLLGAEPLSGGYGLRTMSTVDAGYDPLSYHCGSVWPHDTTIALLGLAATRAHEPAITLMDGLLSAAEAFDYRLPELYGGDARAEVSRPIPYPGACVPQAWAAAAAFGMLQAALGLSADVPRGEFRVRPLVGSGLGQISVRGLRIGGASVDVAVDREGAVRVTGLPPYLRLVTDAELVAAAHDPSRAGRDRR